jgi:uncharacterized protein (TIGR03435 family)
MLSVIRCAAILALAPILAPLSRAQSQAAPVAPAPGATPVFKYEVISIKLTPPTSTNVSIRTPVDGFVAANIPVQMLLTMAYGIQDNQIVGAPAWLNSERFDIDARMDPEIAEAVRKMEPPDRKLVRQQMLQALLADRLMLAIHRESRELSAFALVIGKDGPKLQETKTAQGAPTAVQMAVAGGGASIRDSRNGVGPDTFTALHCSAPNIAAMLSTIVGRPVVDKTGLNSTYDFTLVFQRDDVGTAAAAGGSPVPSPADPAPSLFTAIQEQLGLKLESGKYPVGMIVIDHVEHPSAN